MSELNMDVQRLENNVVVNCFELSIYYVQMVVSIKSCRDISNYNSKNDLNKKKNFRFSSFLNKQCKKSLFIFFSLSTIQLGVEEKKIEKRERKKYRLNNEKHVEFDCLHYNLYECIQIKVMHLSCKW